MSLADDWIVVRAADPTGSAVVVLGQVGDGAPELRRSAGPSARLTGVQLRSGLMTDQCQAVLATTESAAENLADQGVCPGQIVSEDRCSIGGHLKLPAGSHSVPDDGHYGARGGLRLRSVITPCRDRQQRLPTRRVPADMVQSAWNHLTVTQLRWVFDIDTDVAASLEQGYLDQTFPDRITEYLVEP
jgi:hypothetical protein